MIHAKVLSWNEQPFFLAYPYIENITILSNTCTVSVGLNLLTSSKLQYDLILILFHHRESYWDARQWYLETEIQREKYLRKIDNETETEIERQRQRGKEEFKKEKGGKIRKKAWWWWKLLIYHVLSIRGTATCTYIPIFLPLVRSNRVVGASTVREWIAGSLLYTHKERHKQI